LTSTTREKIKACRLWKVKIKRPLSNEQVVIFQLTFLKAIEGAFLMPSSFLKALSCPIIIGLNFNHCQRSDARISTENISFREKLSIKNPGITLVCRRSYSNLKKETLQKPLF